MAATMSLSMRMRALLVAAMVSGSLAGSRAASADACLDASEEARAAIKARHLIEARAKLRQCAAEACVADVRALCDARLVEVSERIPTIIFDAKRPDGTDLFEVASFVDGAPRPDIAMGAEVALDPGPHIVTFRDEAGRAAERRIVVAEREKARREHIVLGAAPEPAPRPTTTIVEVPVIYAPARSAKLMTSGGIFALGAGAAAAAIGVAFGAVAIAREGASGCDASNVCDSPAARSEARMAATVSTVSFVSALGLAAIGVTLLVWPKGQPQRTRLTVAPFALGGTF